MESLILVIAGSGTAFLVAVALYVAVRYQRRVWLIRDGPARETGHLEAGPAKVRGWVVAFLERLQGPVSGKPCVYWRLQVQELRLLVHSHGASVHWKTVVDDVHRLSFGVDTAAVSQGWTSKGPRF